MQKLYVNKIGHDTNLAKLQMYKCIKTQTNYNTVLVLSFYVLSVAVSVNACFDVNRFIYIYMLTSDTEMFVT